MKRNVFSLSFVLMLAFTLVLAGCGSLGGGGEAEADPEEVSMLTGGTGGTYFPLGGEIAEIMSKNTEKSISAQASGASVENIQTLQDGDADLAFTQTDIASYAVEGKMMFKDAKSDNVQAIGTLYPETIQIVVMKNSDIKSVEDLKGKSVSIGDIGSGTAENAKQILEVHGISTDDIEVKNLPFDESAELLQDGELDAAFITSGAPTGAIEGLSALKPVRILPIADDKAKELSEKYPYYAQDTIPSGTYQLEEEVNTVAVLAMLVVRKDLSEDAVYNLTKAFFDNVGDIKHAKGEKISAENALNGVGIDLHPGAEKYYKEKGLK
ncbi:TAXI family TRAP transporter solute-binding subunit [Pseudalkalibacillus berkeleyi]|uniref:TAXI family TRAP transporter solute-binding subunit n=1 Tax=Pseudalkalibacillus berkeleyi TaxID=1069813 RepID=A0ABS9H577_9BACL|nr:TAXI family TRAP transporter solute-binding subunit [Pseudalkalibacillus berkeleyi]MCF6138982.1 TAXI family TRAP transporter solute-binding subunit [Pseudalkalibacillus berkeleyi]